MADQYEHVTGAADIPDRIKITDTLYADGMATITYVYCWGLEGTPGDYSYYTRTLTTKFVVATADILAVRDSIRAEYTAFVDDWDKGAAERATVAGWIGYVILS